MQERFQTLFISAISFHPEMFRLIWEIQSMVLTKRNLIWMPESWCEYRMIKNIVDKCFESKPLL